MLGAGYLKIRNRVAYANLEERSLGTEVEFNVRDVRSPDGHTFRSVGLGRGGSGAEVARWRQPGWAGMQRLAAVPRFLRLPSGLQRWAL